MNKLCEICDTRNRLGMCNGRDGVFKYCFRKVGSTHRLEETITPFNTLHELYKNQERRKAEFLVSFQRINTYKKQRKRGAVLWI